MNYIPLILMLMLFFIALYEFHKNGQWQWLLPAIMAAGLVGYIWFIG